MKISTGIAQRLLESLLKYNDLNPVYRDHRFMEGWSQVEPLDNEALQLPSVEGKRKRVIIDGSDSISSETDLAKLFASIPSHKTADKVVDAMMKIKAKPKKYLSKELVSHNSEGVHLSISGFARALKLPESIAFKVLVGLAEYNNAYVTLKGDLLLMVDRESERQQTAGTQLDIPKIETAKDKTLKLDGVEFKTAAQQHGEVHSKLSGFSYVKEKLKPPAFILAGVLLSANAGIDKEAISHVTETIGHGWEQAVEHLPEIHALELLEKAKALLPGE